tara:strand:- start:277 stop:489 length:213 start_codon:yes stop_codon:yes gene_type:complete
MTKYELEAKIKDKWFVRGFVATLIVSLLSAHFSDNSQIAILISAVITVALSFLFYKSELATSLLNHKEKK